jgi:hypothetical protein
LDDRLRVLPVWDEGARLHALHHTTGWNFKETGPALDKRIAANVRAREKQIVEDHADALRLYSYNETDIASEAEASAITPDLSDDELAYWQDDQTINVRGVRIDLAGVEDCIAIIEQALKRYGDELEALAGCQPSELQQLKGWLHAQGVHLDSMDEDAVETALKGPLPDQARRALEIRAAVGSASVKKVYAMRNSATLAGRLHDLYTYHGARTGRPTGQGPQPTNLPKAGPLSYRCGFRLEGGKEEPLPEGGCGHFHGAHAGAARPRYVVPRTPASGTRGRWKTHSWRSAPARWDSCSGFGATPCTPWLECCAACSSPARGTTLCRLTSPRLRAST